MKIEKKINTKSGISKNVFVLGVVSFLNDISSEMIYPIVPIFLTAVLSVPVTIVGLIEGIAESSNSILRLICGWLSDKLQKRKIFVVLGYLLSAISKIILAFAYIWQIALLSRFLDRSGKGIRTSSRDALISESSNSLIRGRAFGFHRAFDTLGAAMGPVIALFMVKFLQEDLRLIFLLASVPAFLGVFLLFFVKEKKKERTFDYFSYKENLSNSSFSFKVFLLISSIFALGNSSDAFLILKAKNTGLSTSLVILCYILFNLTYAIFSIPAGIISDKIGPKKVLLFGFLLFSFIYLSFGLVKDSIFLWILFPTYGIYMALTEGISKAYISNLVPQEKIGTSFGIYYTTVGICTFFASFAAGLLWSYVSISAPFIFGSITALISAILFIVLTR